MGLDFILSTWNEVEDCNQDSSMSCITCLKGHFGCCEETALWESEE